MELLTSSFHRQRRALLMAPILTPARVAAPIRSEVVPEQRHRNPPGYDDKCFDDEPVRIDITELLQELQASAPAQRQGIHTEEDGENTALNRSAVSITSGTSFRSTAASLRSPPKALSKHVAERAAACAALASSEVSPYNLHKLRDERVASPDHPVDEANEDTAARIPVAVAAPAPITSPTVNRREPDSDSPMRLTSTTTPSRAETRGEALPARRLPPPPPPPSPYHVTPVRQVVSTATGTPHDLVSHIDVCTSPLTVVDPPENRWDVLHSSIAAALNGLWRESRERLLAACELKLSTALSNVLERTLLLEVMEQEATARRELGAREDTVRRRLHVTLTAIVGAWTSFGCPHNAPTNYIEPALRTAFDVSMKAKLLREPQPVSTELSPQNSLSAEALRVPEQQMFTASALTMESGGYAGVSLLRYKETPRRSLYPQPHQHHQQQQQHQNQEDPVREIEYSSPRRPPPPVPSSISLEPLMGDSSATASVTAGTEGLTSAMLASAIPAVRIHRKPSASGKASKERSRAAPPKLDLKPTSVTVLAVTATSPKQRPRTPPTSTVQAAPPPAVREEEQAPVVSLPNSRAPAAHIAGQRFMDPAGTVRDDI
jgi:hypothetical protein